MSKMKLLNSLQLVNLLDDVSIPTVATDIRIFSIDFVMTLIRPMVVKSKPNMN